MFYKPGHRALPSYCSEIFTHQFDRKNMSYIQGVTRWFSKNPNPGQSCHPRIDLMTVLKPKLDKDLKKVVT